MIAGHEVDLRKLIPETVNAGGHVRVGLEDALFGTEMRNIGWVKDAIASIVKDGKMLAKPERDPRFTHLTRLGHKVRRISFHTPDSANLAPLTCWLSQIFRCTHRAYAAF
jgi:hypothetical protein